LPAVEEVKQRLARMTYQIPRLPLYRMLTALLSKRDLVEVLHTSLAWSWQNSEEAIGWFVKEFLPALTAQELAEVREEVRRRIVPSAWPVTTQQTPPITFHVAGPLGLGRDLLPLVAGWPDDHFTRESWHDFVQQPQYVVCGLGDPSLVALHLRRLRLTLRSVQQARIWLAATGNAGLDVLRDAIFQGGNKEHVDALVGVLCLVKAPEAAPYLLEVMLSSKVPKQARDWLDEQTGNAVAGLIPTAAGRGKLAEAAIEYLREAKRKGHAGIIAEQLKVALPDVADKVRKEVLDRVEKVYLPFDRTTTPDWLRPPAAQAGKPAAWVQLVRLPQVVVGEHCLNEDQVRGLLAALQAPAASQAFLTALKQHADPAALDAFAWRLFELWLAEGAPVKEKWAMQAIGALGGDPCALKLTPLIRVWPGESQHPRAVLGLECLRAIGTDTALMQLNGIAQKLKFKALQSRAREFMTAIARDRGMSPAELEDRIVPDLDLDERGERVFDFGPRQFRLALDADLKPVLRDEAGKIRSDLPKPAAKDDAGKAAAAVVDWKLLKKQLREVVKVQLARLEQALVGGRRWSGKDFNTLLARHPLMTHLVRRLLWGRYDSKGKLAGTFRVNEEMASVEAGNQPARLAAEERIGLVHPLQLTADERAQWSEVLADYELLPPFAQLGRPVHTLQPGEEKALTITRLANVAIPALSLVGTLERLGWTRGGAMDAGVYHNFSRQFPGANVTAVIAFENGIPIGYMEGWEDQKVTDCLFVEGLQGPFGYIWVRDGQLQGGEKLLPLREVNPVVLSEVLADLAVLASKGKE
jgi:hypothetical protein